MINNKRCVTICDTAFKVIGSCIMAKTVYEYIHIIPGIVLVF